MTFVSHIASHTKSTICTVLHLNLKILVIVAWRWSF